ncbi:pitrilysin family protein [Picosynechococcus sp. PCC 7117]|uniref:M16 family metallopeptidase n=1 Tax=Picosynechococcus sp. PCC 7117 TaxID=195498 RepID=UPI000810734B|nr:pitrilysin family protein [Picosynechococcus sp. PCC 7117]ANV86464.1 peptidase M16 [Picosynechococcus sp. PCC 7117]
MTSILVPSPRLNQPTIKTLANGLTIIAEQVPVDAVSLNVWLNVGSAVEANSINGMAHFLEHMVFKGTPQIGNGEFEQRIEAKGAVTNAATSQEYTHYYITCAPQDFAELAPLQLDVVLNPSIPDAAFERERQVVLEEIRRSEDNPRRRTYFRAIETGFERLPYRRPVLGPSEVIENLQAQQMRDFHGFWYQPQRMTAAVAGNLEGDRLIELVAAAFDKLYQSQPPATVPTFDDHSPEAPFETIVRRHYEDEGLQQARLVMMWRVPGLTDLEETYALDILATVLGQGKVSRLVQDLREKRGLVTQISVSNFTQKQQGVFYISAQLPAEHIPAVEAAILEQIQTIRTASILPNELERVKTQVANRFIFGNERPSDRTNLYGYYYSLLRDLEPALNYPELLQAITLETIQKSVQKYLNPEAYGIVTLTPPA